jgi:hexulose-6-phosphate isomerase
MNRRTFVNSVGAVWAAGTARAARLPIQKAILVGMLPKELPYRAKFELAREVGFEAIECQTIEDEREAEAIKRASEAAKTPVHSVMNMAHWKYPLSSADPAVVAQSMKGMETSLKNAQLWGADTVLLVPAVVDAATAYRDAWKRSQAQILKLLPLAEKLKIVIGVEDVWNKFLVSPLEFAQYVDEFRSPWVKAYFDVGNIVLFGFPQDWIRTLGKRIVKLHFKDFALRNEGGKRVADFVNLREGDINWKEVHRALAEIGYRGAATLELRGGDKAYLADLSRRMDLILEGA